METMNPCSPVFAELIPFVKTIDYVSNQGSVWLLSAGAIIGGTVIIFLMRLILKEAQSNAIELKQLNERHVEVLERTSTVMANSAAEVRSLGTQVAQALDNAARVIKGNTEVIVDHSDVAKVQIKASDAAATALMDLRSKAETMSSEARRRTEDVESVIRRNTEALEEYLARVKRNTSKRPGLDDK